MIPIYAFGRAFRMDDVQQVINMGGPYVGTLRIDNTVISEDCIADNLLPDNVNGRMYFVRFHNRTRWRSGIYFTINFYEDRNGLVFQSQETFDLVFLKQLLKDNKIEIIQALYDKPEGKTKMFNIQKEKFSPVN